MNSSRTSCITVLILLGALDDNAPAAFRSEMSLGIVSVEAGAMDPAMQLLTRQMFIGLAGLAALFTAIILVARSISRPIRDSPTPRNKSPTEIWK